MLSFTIALIAKNEAKTLPRLNESLKEFKSRGGEIVLLDTGSVDGTADLARSFGFKVEEVGDKYSHVITQEVAKRINHRFIESGETPVVTVGDRYFDFASARNHASSMASTDWVSFVDADEAFTVLDIDAIEKIISDPELAHVEYQFIFAHDQFGKPAVQFVQSKMFNKKKIEWQGIVHECIMPINGGGTRKYLPPDIFLLEHFQQPGDRHSYLKGLAVDCFNHQENDRNSHYFAREMMWTGRFKSAIKEFTRHIEMKRWPAERAQSLTFIGDCWGMLGQPELQVEFYHKAFYTDCTRREPLIKLALFFKHNNNSMSANVYATAALEVGWSDHYANNKADYEHVPHEILYHSKGWFGDIEGAKKHLTKALEFQPYNPKYLADTKFYFEYADHGIEGYMRFAELTFLYSMSKQVTTVAEVGSYRGRSTHALLSGGAHVTAIDHFQGSSDPGDWTHHDKDSFGQFCKNTEGFKNLTVKKMSGKEASEDDATYDMVFIDAGHTYEEVKEDILNWQNKATVVFCGHDYSDLWPGVKRAVDELVGPVLVHDSIWYKFVAPKVSIILPTLGRPDGLKRCLESIDKLRYPKALLETIVIHDQPIKGVSARVKEGFEKSTGQFIVFAANDMEFDPNCIMEAVKCHRATKMGLISFNCGPVLPDAGNICEHFMIDRRLVDKIGGEIFSTRLHHVGTDNLLWAKCDKLGEAIRCESALFTHHHFSKGAPMDDTYHRGWSKVEEDRAILSQELAMLDAKPGFFTFK